MDQDHSADAQLDLACQQVGKFMYHFAQVEAALDCIIGKVLDLDETQIRILAATLPLAKKISTARCAIAEQEKPKRWRDAADKVFSKIARINTDRNVVAHSSFAPAEGGAVEFSHAAADRQLIATRKVWTREMFSQRSQTMKDACETLAAIAEEIFPIYYTEYQYEFEHNFGSEHDYNRYINTTQKIAHSIGGTVTAIDKKDSYVKATIVHPSRKMLVFFIKRYWADEDDEWIQDQIAQIKEADTGQVDLSRLGLAI